MSSTVRIEDQEELSEFVRTHLGHRLTAMVAPICIPQDDRFWRGRNDAYRAAKEGSYVMLRMFIEFLGVKSKGPRPPSDTPRCATIRWLLKRLGVQPKASKTLLSTPTPAQLARARGKSDDDLLIDAFTRFRARWLSPADFGADQEFVARMHRTLCKINAHFTYDQQTLEKKFYDRIASPDDKEWSRAVDIIVQKLDKYFYSVVGQDIVVHLDLEELFIAHYKTRLQLRSNVRGDGLGRPPA